jgi:hypothetical protein
MRVQDDAGCGCGRTQDEWDRQGAVRNQVLMWLPHIVGAFAIAKHRPCKLLYYVPGVVAFYTWWRRFVCARCRYYGRPCSTMLGVMTARMMPRDEAKALDRNTMIADFAFLGALWLIPLPQALKSFKTAILYLGSLAGITGSILSDACGRCGNEFCPMKDVRDNLMG